MWCVGFGFFYVRVGIRLYLGSRIQIRVSSNKIQIRLISTSIRIRGNLNLNLDPVNFRPDLVPGHLQSDPQPMVEGRTWSAGPPCSPRRAPAERSSSPPLLFSPRLHGEVNPIDILNL